MCVLRVLTIILEFRRHTKEGSVFAGTPEYTYIKPDQIQSIIETLRRRNYLDRDPFIAAILYAKRAMNKTVFWLVCYLALPTCTHPVLGFTSTIRPALILKVNSSSQWRSRPARSLLFASVASVLWVLTRRIAIPTMPELQSAISSPSTTLVTWSQVRLRSALSTATDRPLGSLRLVICQ